MGQTKNIDVSAQGSRKASRLPETTTSRETMRRSISAAKMGVYEFDIASRETSWDDGASVIFGSGEHAQTVDYPTLNAIVHPDDRTLHDSVSVGSALGKHEPIFDIRYRIQNPATGDLRWIRAIGETVFEEAVPVTVRGTVHDITDEVAGREELRLQRDRLNFIKEAWLLGTWEYVVGEDGSVWDDRCFEMFGIARKLLVPLDDLKACIHPDDVDAFSQNVEDGLNPDGPGIHSMHFRAYNKKTGKLSWYKTCGKTIFDGRTPVRMLGAIQNADEDMERQDELEALNKELRRSEERLKLATTAGQVGTWTYDAAGKLVGLDQMSKRLMNLQHKDGISFDEISRHIHPEETQLFKLSVASALNPDGQEEMKILFRLHPEHSPDVCWVELRSKTIFIDRKPVLMSGTVRDVTVERLAIEETELMNRELHHRVKNMFATISGMIRMGVRSYPGAEAYAETILGRVQTLSEAHVISMDRDNTAPVNLRQLVEVVLAPYMDTHKDRITISGCDVNIQRHAVSSIGMILHELATNAVKYGALSEQGESLDVTLKECGNADGPPRIELRWCETCPVEIDRVEKGQKGFGSRLIAMSARQMDSAYEPEWSESGMSATFTIPAA